MEKGERQRDQLDATLLVQRRNEGGLEQGRSSGGGQRWLDSGYPLKEEPVRFAASSDAGYEIVKCLGSFQGCWPEQRKDRVTFYWDEQDYCGASKTEKAVLDTLS